MKRKLLLSALILIFTHFGFTQVPDLIVSGYVFDYSTGTTVPIEDQSVDIMIDSTNSGFSYENTVLTDSLGYFADTIELNPPFVVGLVHISTYDSCLGYNQEIVAFFNPGAPPFPVEFLLCDNFTPGCEASFYYYPVDSNAFSSLSYQFMDASIGDPDTWQWDFGDGTTSGEQNPVHTFPDAGTYPVCLTITDTVENCTDTFCMDVEVGEPGPGGCDNFFVHHPTGNPNELEFMGMVVPPPFFQVESWEWDFGDGTTGTGQTITHTFPEDSVDTYTVCLTTTSILQNGDTCVATSCQDVIVNLPYECTAFFIHYPAPDSSLTINFQDMSFTGNGGVPDSWVWDFGDGDSSLLQDPSHTYADTGYYDVCLTITDSLDNCTDTYCETIYVVEIVPPTGCTSGFTYYPDTAALTINFEGFTQSLFPTTWSWEFGDGTTGSGQFVSHTYDSAGVYPVTLITVDSTGCSWVTTMDVWVGNPSFDISGTVFLDSNLTADEGIVRLMTADSLWQDVIVLDSTDILPDGSFIFEDVPMYFFMLYYVQAELTDSSAYFGDYLPTYHISSLTWQSAFPVLPVFSWPADVYMIPANSMNSGPGSITGSVTSLDTRGIMSGVHVMLMDEEMNPYTYVVTDEDGIFEFDNIAYGTYMVHAEMMGIHTTQAVITLSEEIPESQVNFIVEGNTATLSISEDRGIIASSGNVYPNPVTDRAWLEIDSEEPVDLDVMIFNQMGQKVYHERLNIGEGNQRILLNTSSLSPGIHYLNIITENGDNISKKLVKTR